MVVTGPRLATCRAAELSVAPTGGTRGDQLVYLLRAAPGVEQHLAGVGAEHRSRGPAPDRGGGQTHRGAELAHRPEIPYRVVINEAVELAKDYGGTDGHKFVNGVLDKFAADVRG